MKEFIKKNFIDKNYTSGKMLIFIIVTVYPFIIIPNTYGYFYFPRFIFLIVIAILSLLVLFKNKDDYINKKEVLLLLFITFMLISVVLSYDSNTALVGLHGLQIIGDNNNLQLINANRFTGFATYISCIILYMLSRKLKNAEKLVKYMIFTCVIVSIIAIMQYFGFNIIPHESFRNVFRAYGTFGQPNFLGTYTVFILPASIFFTLKNKKFYWLIFDSIIFAGMLVSLTRGVWISFFVTLIILTVYCMRHSEYKKWFIYIMISIVIVSSMLIPTKNGVINKKALSIPENITSGIMLNGNAGSGRIEIWKNTIKLLPKYWTFGIGPDNLIYGGVKSSGNIVDKAHNIYLEMLVTMGIFTLILYLLFLSTFLIKRKNEIGFMYFLMIFTYLVQGFFNIDTIMIMPIFWIVLGLSEGNEKV